MDSDQTLEIIQREMEEITQRVPQAKVEFPEGLDLLDHSKLLLHIQQWMVALNKVEECLEALVKHMAIITQNLSALKFRKKMLQSASEVTSQALFEKMFIKKHFPMYREIESWEGLKRTAGYLKDLLKIKHTKLDRNIQLLRTVNKMLQSGVNLDQLAHQLILEGNSMVPVEIAGQTMTVENLGVVTYDEEDDEAEG